MKKILCSFLSLLMVIGIFSCVPITANAASVDDFNFILNSDKTGYLVSGKDSLSGDIVIPSEYNGLPVVDIATWGFDYNKNITSVTIPKSIKSISQGAFSNCSALTKVILPDGLEVIGKNAFSYCALTSITIPDSVTTIETSAFRGNDLTSIIIPDTVTKLGSSALRENDKLVSVKLPSSLTIIDNYLLMDCKSILTITIPNTVTSIGNEAFRGCKSLLSIAIPKNVTTIGDWAFAGCETFTSITVPDTVITIGERAFSDCINLRTASLPNNLQVLGAGAFYQCESLESVNIPNQLTTINDDMFIRCRKLKTLTIPETVTTIGKGAFSYCAFKEITLPSGLLFIDKNTFLHCNNLEEITIPNGVVKIGQWAFNGCDKLIKVVIPDSVNIIETGAFNNYNKNLTLICSKGSYAETYAKENNINFNDGTVHEHSESQWITDKNATCTTDGSKHTECTVCKEVLKTEKIKATGHKQSSWIVDKAATCSQKGSKHIECAVCKSKLATEEIPTVAHTYGDFIIDKQPTYEATGSKSRHCTRCNAKTDVTTIAKLVLGVPVVTPKNTAKGIEVKWNAIKDADSYMVYSKTYNAKTKKWSGWKNRGTVTATSWTDTAVKSGTKYQYTVRAVNGTAKSEFKSTATILYLAQPSTKIANASTGVKVSWNKIAGATGYTIYRAEYKNGKWSGWKNMGTIKKNSTVSWVDKSAKSGTQYRYTVRAINGSVKSTYKASNTLLYLAQPKTTVKAVSNGINVVWTQSTGAKGYTVYRSEYNAKTKKWSSWKNMGTAKANKKSWTDKSAKKGVTYRYTVKAVNGKVASTYKASANIKR